MNLLFSAQVILLLLAVPAGLAVAYLLKLTVAAGLNPARRQIDGVFRGVRVPHRQFVILIPAHNEEQLLGGVVRGLRALSYPATHVETVVIADNCTDGTAEVARMAGATVLERRDENRRGKGQALNWAMQGPLLNWPRPWDALVVMDADSVLNADFLWFMDERLEQGHLALQGYYGVQNPGESWRTALMTAALAAFHFLRPLGRARFGLPCGLKGNGMCFARPLVERYGYPATSVVEDLELALIYLRHGVDVSFAAGAQVFGQMAATARQADSQRQRWEGGRLPLLRDWALPLWREGWRERNRAKLDAAVDLFVPPLALLAAIVAGGAGMSVVLVLLHASVAGWVAAGIWIGAGMGLAVYVGAGLILTHAPASVWLRMAAAPLFILWKLGIYARMVCTRGRRTPATWVRTDRHDMRP